MFLPFDVAAIQWAQSFATPTLTLLFKAITLLGNPAFWAFIAAWLYWSQKEKESFYLMALAGVSSAIVGVLKFGFQQPRPLPSEFNVLENASGFGFPSAHSALAAAIFSFYEQKLKPWWKVFAFILVILVAFSRLYLGAHFLSDVLAGIVIGLLLGKAFWWFRNRTEHMHFRIAFWKEEMALFILVVVSLAFVYLFEEWMLFALFLGYFFGYAFSAELKLKQSGKSLERKFYGFLGLGVFALSYWYSPTLEQKFLALLVAGLWISFIYPLAVEAYLKPKKKALISDFDLGTEKWKRPYFDAKGNRISKNWTREAEKPKKARKKARKIVRKKRTVRRKKSVKKPAAPKRKRAGKRRAKLKMRSKRYRAKRR
ncbi:MAG: phosphatase PAP2 family protein [Candidatus Diapherotrites archaeon]